MHHAVHCGHTWPRDSSHSKCNYLQRFSWTFTVGNKMLRETMLDRLLLLLSLISVKADNQETVNLIKKTNNHSLILIFEICPGGAEGRRICIKLH